MKQSINDGGSTTFLCESLVVMFLVGAISLGMDIRLVFGELNDLSIRRRIINMLAKAI